MKSDTQNITLRQIAQLAGTSKSTVSRVLTQHPRISEATRRRVMAVIEEQGYRPNAMARNLALGRTGNIGVISRNIGSGFYAEVIRGIDLAASDRSYRLICTFSHTPEDYLNEIHALGQTGQVEGLILIAPFAEVLEETWAPPVPTVFCAARPKPRSPLYSRSDSVWLDNATAMKQLVSHFVGQGFTRLVHLAGPPDNYDALERRRAFEREACAYPNVQSGIIEAGQVREEGRRAAAEYRESRPDKHTAFIAFNDSVARGFSETLSVLHGREFWPVAISGWDDSDYAEPLGLTSVNTPVLDLGQKAAHLLLTRLQTDTGKPAIRRHHLKMPLNLCLRASSCRTTKARNRLCLSA